MTSTSTIQPRSTKAWFVTTHWSVVLSAREKDSAESNLALEKLCRMYWQPLYAFVRRRGYTLHDAQDLTQEFFARLLQKDYLRLVAREKGRFRTFLLVAFKRFLADEWRKVQAQKRGAGQVFAVDWSSAETRFLQQPTEHLTPEKVYEQRWALALLDQVYTRLQNEYAKQAAGTVFETLRFALTGLRNELPYADLARQLGMTEGAVKVATHRLRRRYRQLLREIIAETVSDPEQVEEEMRYLLQALSS